MTNAAEQVLAMVASVAVAVAGSWHCGGVSDCFFGCCGCGFDSSPTARASAAVLMLPVKTLPVEKLFRPTPTRAASQQPFSLLSNRGLCHAERACRLHRESGEHGGQAL
jgi:hypothetical protein